MNSNSLIGKYCKLTKYYKNFSGINSDDLYIIRDLVNKYDYTYVIESLKDGSKMNIHFNHLTTVSDEEVREYKLKL